MMNLICISGSKNFTRAVFCEYYLFLGYLILQIVITSTLCYKKSLIFKVVEETLCQKKKRKGSFISLTLISKKTHYEHSVKITRIKYIIVVKGCLYSYIVWCYYKRGMQYYIVVGGGSYIFCRYEISLLLYIQKSLWVNSWNRKYLGFFIFRNDNFTLKM